MRGLRGVPGERHLRLGNLQRARQEEDCDRDRRNLRPQDTRGRAAPSTELAGKT